MDRLLGLLSLSGFFYAYCFIIIKNNKMESSVRMTKDGLHISSSEIKRLERDLSKLKEKYDSLKIRQLTK
jgi:hypothetical protein